MIDYFKEIMDKYQKPYLILQIDEHGSAVGYETRIESAVQSFRNDFNSDRKKGIKRIHKKLMLEPYNKGIILVPNYDSLSCSFICAAFERAGYKTMLLEETPTTIQTSVSLNDGQCLPISAIVQSAIHTIKKNQLDPAKTAIFVNAITRLSCNFPQYPLMIKRMIERQSGEFNKIQCICNRF